MTTLTPKIADESCHNCRRRRWKCDRSLPACLKCAKKGQECQGYGRHLRWDQGIASRGKLTGKTTLANASTSPRSSSSSASPSIGTSGASSLVSSPRSFVEDNTTRMDSETEPYLDYFSKNVSKELVLHDDAASNPYRELVTLANRYQVLYHIMVAMAALHMSNSLQRSINGAISKKSELESSTGSSKELQRIALSAKQKALRSLKYLLERKDEADADAALAAVLLFIEFDLLDSGKNDWTHHIKGAHTIIQTLSKADMSGRTEMSPLRRSLISNYLIYEVIGSTFSGSINQKPSDLATTGTICLLQDTQGVHCSGFPLELLMIVRKAAYVLSQVSQIGSRLPVEFSECEIELKRLLQATREFDAFTWSFKIRSVSSIEDIFGRAYVALAHRAAVCIYLSRILAFICPETIAPYNLRSLVQEIIGHVSHIPREGSSFTALAWPVFIAGAEADTIEAQQWAAGIFEDLWQIQPWGLIRGARGLLQSIWDSRTKRLAISQDDIVIDETQDNWVMELRNSGIDWLII